MTKYKLYNTEKRELISRFRFKPHQIRTIKFTYTLLRDCLSKYVGSYTISHYCCRGEDNCCWQDAEDCWMNGSSKEKNMKILKSVKYAMHSVKRKISSFDVYTRKMIIAEDKNRIWILIPLRDIIKEDYCIGVNKNQRL